MPAPTRTTVQMPAASSSPAPITPTPPAAGATSGGQLLDFDLGTDTGTDTDIDVDPADPDLQVDGDLPDTADEGGGVSGAADGNSSKPASKLEEFLGGKRPEWMKELIETDDTEVADEDFDQLDIRAKQILAKIVKRGDVAAKAAADNAQAQAVAEQALKAREVDAQDLATDAFKAFRSPELAAFLEKMKPTGPVPDPDSPEGIDYRVKLGVAEQLKGWLEQLQAADKAETAKTAEVRAKAAYEKQVAELGTYMDAHREDFDNPQVFKSIEDLVQRSKGGISPQEAHQLVMARYAMDGAEDKDAAVAQARRAVQPSGRAGRQIPRMPVSIQGNAVSEMEWYAAHPEAEARDRAEYERAMDYGVIAREEREQARAARK